MRRAAIDDNASLELLLDTICNTFGGVLFISILVVVMLNSTSAKREMSLSPPDERVQADLIEWRKKLADANEQTNALLAALGEQREMAQSLVDPNIRELLQQLDHQRRRRTEFEQRRLASLQARAESDQQVNTIATRLAALDATLAAARQRQLRAAEALEREVAMRSRAAKLPRGRTTTKQAAVMLLRGGRLTSYAAVDANGELVRNRFEVEELDDDSGAYLSPRADAGVHIAPDANSETIENRFTSYDPERHFIALAVWPDSFASFPVVREALVRANLEYALIPFPADGKAYLGRGVDEWLVQ